MSKIISIIASDGSKVEFYDEVRDSGGVKDCYFSPDKSYVVLFYRSLNEPKQVVKDRLLEITGKFRDRIFNQVGGEYWKDLYCWPNKVVEWNDKIGIVAPFYPNNFFFEYGKNPALPPEDSIKGKAKNGKWFATPQFRNEKFRHHLDKREWGDFSKTLSICLKISRAIKRLHAAGLAYSDLSFNNVLIDPITSRAIIIDIDDLVVPGKMPPKVIGTRGFIAPEVVATQNLPTSNPARKLPSIYTDRHALAVLIYQYLLRRHPLEGGKIHDMNDSQNDEKLAFGVNALFAEHPTNKSNAVKPSQLKPTWLPWADPNKLPYDICGPYLKELFDAAFIKTLHDPMNRPTANAWEDALILTVDLLQPCQNTNCDQKWYVFANTTKPVCPFCGTAYKGQLPVINFYSKTPRGQFSFENKRLMVYSGQNIYQWHVNKNVSPNERLTPEQRKPVADFHFHNNKWILINRTLTSLVDKDTDTPIEIGKAVDITNDKKILLSKEEGGRLIVVQLVNN